MARYELFGSSACQYTEEMREWLDLHGCDYVEYDVERDASAFARMVAASGGQRMVPTLLEDGLVKEVGWQGRGCVVSQPR